MSKKKDRKIEELTEEVESHAMQLATVEAWNNNTLRQFSPWMAKELDAILNGERPVMGFRSE